MNPHSVKLEARLLVLGYLLRQNALPRTRDGPFALVHAILSKAYATARWFNGLIA